MTGTVRADWQLRMAARTHGVPYGKKPKPKPVRERRDPVDMGQWNATRNLTLQAYRDGDPIAVLEYSHTALKAANALPNGTVDRSRVLEARRWARQKAQGI